MALTEAVERTLLIASLQTLETSPHYLSSPISVAASRTLKQLRIVLISPFFNAPSGSGSRNPGVSRTERWDEVQRLLTYVYVQATRVAQELGRILMDIDVLLQAEGDVVPAALGADAQRVFRVSLSGENDGLSNLPISISNRSADTTWLEPTVYHAPSATSSQPPHTPLHPTESGLPDVFPVTALGGTFDHLHAGHKILLSMAAWITSQKLIVGITDDALLKNKANKHVLQNLPTRIQHARNFLTLFKPEVEYDIVPISDVYGPTAWDPNIQALVVSKETLSGGAAIEKHRKEKGLSSLKTFVIDVISSTEANLDADDAEALKKTKMSSTFIREWIVEQQKKGVQVE